MSHNRIRNAQVTFRVFEVNWVDFMRHGRRADFACNGFLFEEAHRNVAPNITIEIDQNRIETTDSIEQFCDVIVWLDLSRVRVPR